MIQDSVLLRKEHPEHYLFQDRIFSTQAYHDYEVVFLAALVAQPSPAELTIRMAMPAMEEKVTSGFSSVHTRVAFLDGKMDTLLKLNVASARIMHDVFDGKAPVKLQASWPTSNGSISTSQVPALEPEHAHRNVLANPYSAEDLVSAAALLSVPDEAVQGSMQANVEQQQQVSPMDTLRQILNPHEQMQRAPPTIFDTYHFPDSLPSAAEHWREYKEGLRGQPPMSSTFDTTNHRWGGVDGEKMRKRFERRMLIINTVKELSTRHNLPGDAIARRIDEICRAQKPMLTMYKLREECRKRTFAFEL